jgi:hypothetical protein
MSLLKTYDRQTTGEPEGGRAIIKHDQSWVSRLKRRRPGDWVKHKDDGGLGVLIAISGDGGECLVLWSVEPRRDNLRYNPLSMDEDYWIPVKPLKGFTVTR